MTRFRPADHAMGLELQIEELQEQRRRAEVQARDGDARRLESEIEALQAELARTADQIAAEGADTGPGPELHDAAKLSPTPP